MKKLLFLISFCSIVLIANFAMALDPKVKPVSEMTKEEKAREIATLEKTLEANFNDIFAIIKTFRDGKKVASKEEGNRNFLKSYEYNENVRRYKDLTGEEYNHFKKQTERMKNQKPNTGGDFDSSSQWINKIQDNTMTAMGGVQPPQVMGGSLKTFNVCKN